MYVVDRGQLNSHWRNDRGLRSPLRFCQKVGRRPDGRQEDDGGRDDRRYL